MYSNQDILRIHSSNKLSAYDAGTTMAMFPLRLETKFINRPVKKYCDEHKVLWVLDKIWNLVLALKSEEKDIITDRLEKLILASEDIKIIYKEDRSYILDLLNHLKKSKFESHDPELSQAIQNRLNQVIQNINSLACTSASKDNRATNFLRKANRVISLMNNIIVKDNIFGQEEFVYKEMFSGKQREEKLCIYSNKYEDSPYSLSVFYKSRNKCLKKILAFYNTFEKELSKIPSLDNQQRKSLISIMKALKDRLEVFRDKETKEISFVKHSSLIIPSSKEREKEMSTRNRNFYYSYRECCKTFFPLCDKIKAFSLIDLEKKLRAKCPRIASKGLHYRYTQLARVLIKQEINDCCFNSQDSVRLRNLAKRTLFNYQQEQDWLISLLSHYNNKASKENQITISTGYLRKNDRYIRRRKMTYTHSEKCLCVRIYPDELAVTQLHNALSKKEISDVKTFLDEYFSTGRTIKNQRRIKDPKQSAWDKLCLLYPPYRAAWIVRNYVRFPEKAAIEKDQRFSIPISKWMPSRFTIQAAVKINSKREEVISRIGNRLPDILNVGLDFNQEGEDVFQNTIDTSNGHIRFKNQIKWMTDYDEAEKIGMAITIPLSSFKFGKKKTMRNYEFNSIYVLGAKEDINIQNKEGFEMLQQLLECHLFSANGMDLIKQGTATNILSNKDETSFDSSTTRQKEVYFKMITSSLKKHKTSKVNPPSYAWEVNNSEHSDASILNALLGKVKNQPILETTNADKYEIQYARLANKYLLDAFATNDNLLGFIKYNSTVYEYFWRYVLARSPYSSIRIGTQPYGLLLSSDLRNLKFFNSPMSLVRDVLTYLADNWNLIAEQNNVVEPQEDSSKFLHLMGKTPNSSSFLTQQSVKVDDFFLPALFRGLNLGVNPLDDLRKIRDINPIYLEIVSQYLNYIPLNDEEYTTSLADDSNPLFSHIQNLKTYIKNESGQDISDDQARNLIVEFFDLFNYRLDAWIQGLIAYHHEINPLKNNYGLVIGCYGWIFDLKENYATRSGLEEYILAPSINQATTAAILRGGYKNRIQSSDNSTDSLSLNINLSSQRVRKAKRIVEGIRNGLPIGAILGADAERLLHDAYKEKPSIEMDSFIYPLRQAFPLNASINKDENSPKDLSTSPIVINGALLLHSILEWMGTDKKKLNIEEYFLDSRIDSFMAWCGENLITFEQGENGVRKCKRLIKIIQQVYDSYDAVMDVVLSDGIYLLCQGNTEAASAVMNALQNNTALPMPSVTEIPQASARLENKVIAFIEDVDPNTYLFEPTHLSAADPSLNEWMRQIIGNEGKSLYEAGLEPADLVYLSENNGYFIKYLDYLSEKKQILGLSEDYKRLEWVLEATRELLSRSYALRNDDLMYHSAKKAVDNIYDSEELKDRFLNLYESVKLIYFKLENLSKYENTDISIEESIKEVLWECFALGHTLVPELIENESVISAANTLISLLQESIIAAFAELNLVLPEFSQENLEALETELRSGSSLTHTNYIKAMGKLTIANLKVVPLLSLYKPEPESDTQVPILDEQISELIEQSRSNIFANIKEEYNEKLENFVSEMADLRPAMQAFFRQRLFGDWNENKPQALSAMQLPRISKEGDSPDWLGLEARDESKIHDANVYLATNAQVLQNPSKKVRALVLDFWTEKIPLKDQTCGLAFNFDQPDAEPPQAILLAMSMTHKKRAVWTTRRLTRSILCTLHLIKSRAVEPDNLRHDPWGSSLFPILNPPLINSSKK